MDFEYVREEEDEIYEVGINLDLLDKLGELLYSLNEILEKPFIIHKIPLFKEKPYEN
jgi:hypothetical protein